MHKRIFGLILTLAVVFSSVAFGECVHEGKLSGAEILWQVAQGEEIFIARGQGLFKNAQELGQELFTSQEHIYDVQYGTEAESYEKGGVQDYNARYVAYYTYQKMLDFIASKKEFFKSKGHKIEIIGKSLQGRNLYAITPERPVAGKKSIVMFGRHHGDEGTANYIIEGFVNLLAQHDDFFEHFQLFLYPMVNPDGAEAMTRYNSKGRDLNRVWGKTPAQALDEVKTIQTHLYRYLNGQYPITIALDMHGSFTQDFIYRVNRNFKGADFFQLQSAFIEHLGRLDQWQNGNIELSDGDPGMSRITLIRDFSINALTHESIRNIPKNQGRDIKELQSQGVALLTSILDLYKAPAL